MTPEYIKLLDKIILSRTSAKKESWARWTFTIGLAISLKWVLCIVPLLIAIGATMSGDDRWILWVVIHTIFYALFRHLEKDCRRERIKWQKIWQDMIDEVELKKTLATST